MQNESFSDELSILKDPTKGNTPLLVKNINVFMDQEVILRVDGRIANSSRYGYEILYTILLAKHHPYSDLVIDEYH